MFLKWLILLGMVLISALGVVYSKYHTRKLFIEIQNLESRLDQYEEDWGRLQLELTTHADHGEIERHARKELKMRMPQSEKIIYIKP